MAKRHYILGTAGHVDHGKTELVRALTGWDTDRLKEEKERGISIELGFAPLPLDDTTMLGVVDVPGHERFVKHMVAGAGGVDMAILVVAADESVMPQTREHLEVLRSLRVARGIVVITKIDLAAEDLVKMVRDDVADLVRGTFLEGAPVVETSARTGAGVDALRKTLIELCGDISPRPTAGPFRLAIDRVFHKDGIGVVITGSCYSGTVAVGDTLELMPSGKTVRVRDLQSFGERRERGYAGERLAIALHGGKLGEVSRGDMLTTPAAFTASYVMDARIRVASYAKFTLKQRQRIRIHHGGREVLGRVVLLESTALRSGDEALVQLRLESPVVAGDGDFIVIRTYSPARVLGGGSIINANADKHRSGDRKALEDLAIREAGDPAQQTRKALADAGIQGVAVSECDAAIIDELIDEGTALRIGNRVFDTVCIDTLGSDIERLAGEFLQSHPLRYGMDKEELRRRLDFPHATPLFNQTLEVIAKRHAVFTRGKEVRAGTKDVELSAGLAADVRGLEQTIRSAGVRFPRYAELEGKWRGDAALGDVLQFLREGARVERIGEDGYMHQEALKVVLTKLAGWFAERKDIGVVDFKNIFDITRKHAIPLLEYLDAQRYTRRSGDVRLAGPDLQN